MDAHEELLRRIEALEARNRELEAEVAALRTRDEELEAQVESLQARNADLEARNAELEARNAALERELSRRGKRYKPKANVKRKRKKPSEDRRRKPHRRHGGFTRPDPPNLEDAIHHDEHLEHCPCCGSGDLEATGEFVDSYVEDIPEPKVEVHRYRRHVYRCRHCDKRVKGRGDLDVPGATVGPRVRLLSVYGRAYLGISLGKTATLLNDLFGISLSRAGVLGHLRWFARQFDPVVQELLELLKQSAVVHADETGWRIDGKNVWCWCFSNPTIAVFLIDHSRSRAVFEEALGTSLPGTLVTDFYAAYNAIDCRKQRCLVHLLRDLAKLRDELPAALVTRHIRPLIELFQDAIALANERSELPDEEFTRRAEELRRRLDDRYWRSSSNPDCQRIYKRLRRHKDELLTFLDDPRIPPHNNPAESDIRSVVATRGDGGVNRVEWSAGAFAIGKTIVRTCQKVGANFFRYSLRAIDKIRAGKPPPLPDPDTG